jgi:hypothetical protein
MVTLPVSALATASIAALASAIVLGEGVCAISKTVLHMVGSLVGFGYS